MPEGVHAHNQRQDRCRIHRMRRPRLHAQGLLDLGSRGMVDVTLSQLVSDGIIRRAGRGLYDVPKHSEALGSTLSPNVDELAQAIARRFRWRIIPTGARRQISSASRRKFPPRSPICPMVRTGNSNWGNRLSASNTRGLRRCEPRVPIEPGRSGPSVLGQAGGRPRSHRPARNRLSPVDKRRLCAIPDIPRIGSSPWLGRLPRRTPDGQGGDMSGNARRPVP